MKFVKQTRGLVWAMLLLSGAVNAASTAMDKPQTMEEMWQIIQAQQKQINAMSQSLNDVSKHQDMVELERKQDVLSEEVENIRTEMFIPEETVYKSEYGLGPAASKVYQVDQGLSIGAYGEANFQTYVGDNDSGKNNNADFERLVLYFGYKFTDSIIFNSEIEIEHGSTDKNGSVSVEFAALDFLLDPMFNIRTGMVLLPMGFINQIHEPPFYFGNNRPEVERRIIPSTWREIGGGLFGEILPGLTYTTYAINGLNAEGFSSKGIRGGRQKGSKVLADDLAFVGQLNYAFPAETGITGLTVGASAYLGNSGQEQYYAGVQADVFTQLYEVHAQWKYRGLEFRTLGSWGFINNADVLSAAKGETIGSSNYGWYTELGYDVLPHILPNTTQYLAPFFRYEMYDTIASAPTGFADNGFYDQQIYQFGLQYKPIPNVVIKADYRNFSSKDGQIPDDFNIGFGFIF